MCGMQGAVHDTAGRPIGNHRPETPKVTCRFWAVLSGDWLMWVTLRQVKTLVFNGVIYIVTHDNFLPTADPSLISLQSLQIINHVIGITTIKVCEGEALNHNKWSWSPQAGPAALVRNLLGEITCRLGLESWVPCVNIELFDTKLSFFAVSISGETCSMSLVRLITLSHSAPQFEQV